MIRQATGPLTSFYVLAAIDLRLDAGGSRARRAGRPGVFVDVFMRTFWISAVVAVLCALLGYPLAYLLANLREALSRIHC